MVHVRVRGAPGGVAEEAGVPTVADEPHRPRSHRAILRGAARHAHAGRHPDSGSPARETLTGQYTTTRRDACAVCAGDDDDEQHVAGLVGHHQRQLGEQHNREARILAGPIRTHTFSYPYLHLVAPKRTLFASCARRSRWLRGPRRRKP